MPEAMSRALRCFVASALVLHDCKTECGFIDNGGLTCMFGNMQVVEKEEEKATLLTMCNELMSKLEKEGISL